MNTSFRDGQGASVNILSEENGSGLSRTSRIVSSLLEGAGHAVAVYDYRHAPPQGAPAHANVFLEQIAQEWLPRAAVNLLVPNQEWFWRRDLPLLPAIDLVLCKTRYAQRLFADRGCTTAFTGFTSFDRHLVDRTQDFDRFLHIAGRSLQKGTGVLLELWHDHPEWPELTVVQHPETRLRVTAANVRYVSAHLDDASLARLQNDHGVHLYPSEAEGWGHAMVEAMSCGAVVVTTDAPPMNEVVTPARGVLVGYAATKEQGLGSNYYVDPRLLERAIVGLLDTPAERKQALGSAARQWYERNDAAFRAAFAQVLDGVLPSLDGSTTGSAP